MRLNTVTGTALGLTAVLSAVVPAWAQGPKGDAGPAQAVARLVEQIKRNPPARAKAGPMRNQLYLADVETGAVTLVADEPDAGLSHCGSPWWSSDGTRILFDATPGNEWNRTRIKALEAGATRPRLTDLGPGNCPSLAPDGKRIAFLLNPDAVADAESGVWVMKSDNTGRRRLDGYGRPWWSPDGRQLLVCSFSTPCELSVMDPETGDDRPVQVNGHQIYSVPRWASDRTIVASLGANFGDTIALIDVTDPDQGKVTEVLWKKGGDPDVNPTYPVYSPASGRCVFVDAGPRGMALYRVTRGRSGPPHRLEPPGHDKFLSDLAFSPDGRYVLFCADRSDRPTP